MDILGQKITEQNKDDIRKRIEAGIRDSLRIGTIDVPAAREALGRTDELVHLGTDVYSVLRSLNNIIQDSLVKTGFVSYDSMKPIWRKFI